MTTRHIGYLVVLDKDLREDDAEPILSALRLVKGVATVEPIVPGFGSKLEEDAAKSRARHQVMVAVTEALYSEKFPERR